MRSLSKLRASDRIARQTMTLAAGVVVGLLAIVPLPYFAISPGRAVDLTTRVSVEGRAAARTHFFLTDVSVTRATPLGMLARFLPATEIVPSASLIPSGENPEAFDRSMVDAMTESQNVAGFVAERAAGYRIAENFIVSVAAFPPRAPARKTLRKNDRVLSVAGRPVHSSDDIARAIAAVNANVPVEVAVQRNGRRATVAVALMRGPDGVKRLGIYASVRLPGRDLPVPIRFAMNDVSGSSGGLLFALQIYADLGANFGSRSIAGTGTLAPDGRVGPIEGTRQKLEAAKRAGARIFFVPKRNFADLADLADRKVDTIAIVPVATFADAVAYLRANP